jgi:hypothetical protein
MNNVLDCLKCTRYGPMCQKCGEWQAIKIIRKQ